MAVFPIGIRIEAHEYAAFLRAIPRDTRLPPSYDGWINRRREEDAQVLKKGGRINEVLVDYTGFAKYCRDAAQTPTYVMLMAYAVTKSIE